MQVKRYKVAYTDDDGTAKETRSMSRAEAEETARRLRFAQARDVHVVPVSQPRPLPGHDREPGR